MTDLIIWLETNEKLSGWAQFLGTMLALILTYLTAFMPIWRRKRQLHQSGLRLLSHGYEAVESYYSTSQHFLPFALSVRGAAMTMRNVAEQIDRFPIFELDDQGPKSLARCLVSTAVTLRGTILFLEHYEEILNERDGTSEDQNEIRSFIGDRMSFFQDMFAGKDLKRPEWPVNAKPTH
jgi:hypothetical protein